MNQLGFDAGPGKVAQSDIWDTLLSNMQFNNNLPDTEIAHSDYVGIKGPPWNY